MSQKTIEKLFSARARVMAAASTSCKVKGLTLALREQYLSKIADVLYTNYTSCMDEEDQSLDKKDVEDCGVTLEYEAFSSNTTMTMYRNSIAKLVRIFIQFSKFIIRAKKYLSYSWPWSNISVA